MTPPPLLESTLSREELFRGHFLTAWRDTVQLPDGAQATREYVTHPGAVVVVPLLSQPDGSLRVVLERQYRYPVAQVMIEFPAGKLELGEDPLLCAQRELAEETGYRATQWAKAGVMHLAIAYSTEVIHIYFAKGLVPGDTQLDEGEFLQVFQASPDELMDWCRNGQVTDAKTLTCCLWLQQLLTGAWGLEWTSQPAQVAPDL